MMRVIDGGKGEGPATPGGAGGGGESLRGGGIIYRPCNCPACEAKAREKALISCLKSALDLSIGLILGFIIYMCLD